jgi:sugar phosphate isomerase/epimerase
MCRAVTGAAVLSATAPLAAMPQPRFGLRYILASSLYGKMPLEVILPEVQRTGAEHIDLWPEGHANQREQMEAMGHDRFAALLEKHGVRLGMTTRYDLGPLRLQDEMAVLKRFGAPRGVAGRRRAQDVYGAPAQDGRGAFVKEMAPHVAAAERLGVTIAIENHAHALIATVDSIRYLAEAACSPNLGIALAPYHLPQDPQLLAKLIDDLGPKLVHFYAWQEGKGCFRKLPKAEELEQMPGRGSLDFRPILAALRRINYRGWTEIFMHPVPRGIPILETAAEVTAEVNRARDYLDRLAATE